MRGPYDLPVDTFSAGGASEGWDQWLRRHVKTASHDLHHFASHAAANPAYAGRVVRGRFTRHVFTFTNLLIAVWLLALYWGEVAVFNSSIAACDWRHWEQWPPEARPHHLALVTDPQLVDPHTYPGRPWPLSTLTIKHTDIYLTRAYRRVQSALDPSTVMFLGDLFDGGREWATRTSKSPIPLFHRYGDRFWQKELRRFDRIFLREHDAARAPGERRLIASLPGNHDLGFGRLIQKPVRDRFHAFLGEGSRVDVVANHTFVFVDTLSLSAKEQEGSNENYVLWGPAQDFLDSVGHRRAEAVQRHLDLLASRPHEHRAHWEHDVRAVDDPAASNKPPFAIPRPDAEFPTLLVSHVPLHRAEDVDCGPLRESAQKSLRIAAGYQYQNVISRPLSQAVVDALEGDVALAFSGDDHDYCEVVHDGYNAHAKDAVGLREITVKSISWAMGVRRPGFLLVSLWNPVDKQGKSTSPVSKWDRARTVQTRLCLLPDQLAVFLRYAWLFAASAVFCLVRVVLLVVAPHLVPFSSAPRRARGFSRSLLPTTSSAEAEKTRLARAYSLPSRSRGFSASSPYGSGNGSGNGSSNGSGKGSGKGSGNGSGSGYGNGTSNGYSNGNGNGYANGANATNGYALNPSGSSSSNLSADETFLSARTPRSQPRGSYGYGVETSVSALSDPYDLDYRPPKRRPAWVRKRSGEGGEESVVLVVLRETAREVWHVGRVALVWFVWLWWFR